uniref:Uncharacterized protein n=1 Tax=Rhizophora mucronata TaxID=61149 RepID=A0A2P2IIL5_RHIMU
MAMTKPNAFDNWGEGDR